MKQLSIIIVAMVAISQAFAQSVGIGTNAPAASTELDISSTSKGFLMPRMTTAKRDAIASPAIGLMIINLDDNCMDTWNGNTWLKNCGVKLDMATISDYWRQKTNFGGTQRTLVVGFSIGSKGFPGTGWDGHRGELEDGQWSLVNCSMFNVQNSSLLLQHQIPA